MEQLADEIVEALFIEHQRHLVNRMLHVARFDHAARRNIAEHRELLAQLGIQRIFGAAKQDLRLQPDLAQFRDTLLRRLGLELARRANVGDERHVHVDHILWADFENELADRFQERQTLDVARRSADLGDDDIGVAFRRHFTNAILDLVGHVRNHLHSFTQVIAAPLLEDHVFVDLAAGEIVVARKNAIGEALVMAEIEVGFRAVVQHVNFSMLERVHRSRIHVQVGIELLEHDPQTAQLEKRAEGSSGQALAQRTHHSARNKNIFHRRLDRFRSPLRRPAENIMRSIVRASSGVSTPGDPLPVMTT